MPDFKSTDVDSRQIDNIANGIDNEINELLSINAVLKDGIIAQLEPYWQGTAKQSFESQFSLYISGFSKLIDGYKELNEQLKKAANAYNKADDSVKQLIAKMPK